MQNFQTGTLYNFNIIDSSFSDINSQLEYPAFLAHIETSKLAADIVGLLYVKNVNFKNVISTGPIESFISVIIKEIFEIEVTNVKMINVMQNKKS